MPVAYPGYVELVRKIGVFEPVDLEHWTALPDHDKTNALRELGNRVLQLRCNEEYRKREGYEKTHGPTW